jgi:hypothetical protein
LKITTLPIIVMFIASALILPVGVSYATYAPGFTTGAPTVQPMDNQTSTNQTMMNSGMNQTSMPPAMNQTMTMPSGMNQTSMPPAMNQTMTPTTVSPPVVTAPKTLLPLEQVKAGVAPKDVQCKPGFTLIFKAEDGSPACVDPTVATILAQRGW